MEGDGSPLSSLCMVRAAELFPKPEPEKEDDSLKVPFTELAGEFVRYIGRTDDGVLALSNYRICLKSQASAPETDISIPLGVIEYVSVRDLFQLVVSCKDASTFRCTFPSSEQASEWQRRITLFVGVPNSLETLFAFSYYAWASEQIPNPDNEWLGRMQRASNYDDDFQREVRRLEFNTCAWRISTVNVDFKMCASYPRLILVPICITDDILINVSNFRSAQRIPAVVWRHKASGAVIGRCSQPEVGWLGWRNPKDEQFIKAIADASAFDGGEIRRQLANMNNASETSSNDESHVEVVLDEVKKMLIVDARSYASAVTNRARGGGCECPEYYPGAVIEFMNLGNIHVIRKSFHALRALAASPTDSQSWFTALDRTMWLSHLAGLIQSSVRICHVVEREGRSVMVHCSDGWDRTPQLVSTALLCLDPYYRTVDGFRVLVEREWLSFGHKFADRIGHGPLSLETNERCPVFLQWLDCVHQIQKQFPCSFEFSMAFLIKLAQHVFSCMFGTFLCNTYKERVEASVFDRTYSVWPFLSGPMYKNPLYIPNREQVLWPAYHISNLSYWSEVYSSSFGNQNQSDSSMTTSISPLAPVAVATASVGTSIVTPSTNDVSNSEPRSPMIKTRSYGDLQTAGCNGISNGMIRRSSDPNMTADAHFNMNLSNEPSIETLPEFYANGANVVDMNVINDQTIANFCSDTIRELNNLTEELQQTDLGEISIRSNHHENSNQINSFSSRIMDTALSSSSKSVHDDGIACVHNSRDGFINSQTNAHSSITDHNYAIPIHHNGTVISKKLGTETEIGNMNCDVVDSSPFYTQFNKYHSENNFLEMSRVSRDNKSHHKNNQTEKYAHANGRESSEDSRDDDYRKTLCMLQSVDLSDTSPLSFSPMNAQAQWHGNIETSTDTLVPVDTFSSNLAEDQLCSELSTAIISPVKDLATCENGVEMSGNYNLPEVHIKSKSLPNGASALNTMDESILIQPEQNRMEISNGVNRNELNQSSVSSMPNGNLSLYRRRRNSFNSKPSVWTVDSAITSHVRSDSVSPNIMNNLKCVLSNTSRSLITPPSIRTINTPSQSANISLISCPDGLAHTLNEQNLRLQQIVQEHKNREEALQRELQVLRLELIRKRSCPNCNNGQTNNGTTTNVVDETNSMFDNGAENASICSWEAVDERSGPSGLNSTNAISSSVLWVPDHAVSKCTNCHTEFWLGRRKHHCRSCGQIFCADCSEHWAALPYECFNGPVRLCGACYQTISKSQNHEQSQNSTTYAQSSSMSSTEGRSSTQHYHTNGTTSSATTSLEPCKHSMNSTKNDQSPTKATTVTH